MTVATEILGCSDRTIKRAIDAGELRASQLADRGCWVIRREDLLAWIDARVVTHQPLTQTKPAPSRTAARAARALARPGSTGGGLRAKLANMEDAA